MSSKNPFRVEIAALWFHQSQKGPGVYSGTLEKGEQVLVFKNTKGKGDKAPAFKVCKQMQASEGQAKKTTAIAALWPSQSQSRRAFAGHWMGKARLVMEMEPASQNAKAPAARLYVEH